MQLPVCIPIGQRTRAQCAKRVGQRADGTAVERERWYQKLAMVEFKSARTIAGSEVPRSTGYALPKV